MDGLAMEADEYRRRARQGLEQARLADDPVVRAKLVDLAATWMRFAERAERKQPIADQQQQPVLQQQQQVQPKKPRGRQQG